ncbi:MAG: Ni,Fe-hydrogenase maturation factor [Chloroflexi bacterium B3_Chlor]|nr:MAG: Ni,Fe-hydrogenase maturation factor [Chloroflexi bacterium B3_Chlor]
MDNASEGRVLVLGVGNLLLGDEGVGIHAVRELEGRALPPHVDVVDGGTPGLDLPDLISGYERVMIIDAVDAGAKPGTIFRFTPGDVTPKADAFPLSLHQVEILKVLELATCLGQALPPIVVYGIQPEDLSWRMNLSTALQERLPELVEAILEEL